MILRYYRHSIKLAQTSLFKCNDNTNDGTNTYLLTKKDVRGKRSFWRLYLSVCRDLSLVRLLLPLLNPLLRLGLRPQIAPLHLLLPFQVVYQTTAAPPIQHFGIRLIRIILCRSDLGCLLIKVLTKGVDGIIDLTEINELNWLLCYTVIRLLSIWLRSDFDRISFFLNGKTGFIFVIWSLSELRFL